MPLLDPSSLDSAIVEALGSGKANDIEAAFQWLASEDNEPVLTSAMKTAATTGVVGHHAAEAKLRFLHLALVRGAKPNSTCEANGLRPETETKEMATLSIVSTEAAYFSPSVIDLLIKRGARVDCTQSKITKSTYERTEICRASALACAILYAPRFTTQHLAVAHALLRGGASLDSAAMIMVENANGASSHSVPIEWVLEKRERQNPFLANNAHYLALKAFLHSVRAAGDYRSFVIEQRRSCALMRHLAIRGRATTHDGPLGFLARTGEQGLFRRVLSYLSPPPLRRHIIPFNITVRGTLPFDNILELYFRIHKIKRLSKLFKAFATRRGVPVDRLVFSLPASPDVLIEGCQTSDDLGLAEGSVIDATLCDEHPARLREKAAAAAAVAAAAARRYLEDLEARRVAGAEVEDPAARAAAA